MFEEFKVTSICYSGGYAWARTVPKHSKANKKGLYPLHRIIVENNLHRLLSHNEVVHHKNGVKTDNRLDNLEVLLNGDHTRKHKREEKIKCVCAYCGNSFFISPYWFRIRTNRNVSKKVFCSRHCGALYQNANKRTIAG
jgi:hypothetical protein